MVRRPADDVHRRERHDARLFQCAGFEYRDSRVEERSHAVSTERPRSILLCEENTSFVQYLPSVP